MLCAFTCINSLHTLLVLGAGASFPSLPPKSRSDHGDPRVIARLWAGIARLVGGEVNCMQGEHRGQSDLVALQAAATVASVCPRMK